MFTLSFLDISGISLTCIPVGTLRPSDISYTFAASKVHFYPVVIGLFFSLTELYDSRRCFQPHSKAAYRASNWNYRTRVSLWSGDFDSDHFSFPGSRQSVCSPTNGKPIALLQTRRSIHARHIESYPKRSNGLRGLLFLTTSIYMAYPLALPCALTLWHRGSDTQPMHKLLNILIQALLSYTTQGTYVIQIMYTSPENPVTTLFYSGRQLLWTSYLNPRRLLEQSDPYFVAKGVEKLSHARTYWPARRSSTKLYFQVQPTRLWYSRCHLEVSWAPRSLVISDGLYPNINIYVDGLILSL